MKLRHCGAGRLSLLFGGALPCAIVAYALLTGCGHTSASSSLQNATLQNDPQLEATFTRTVIPVGHRPGPLAIADVNHDGHPDIIVANMDDRTVTVLLGDGKGNFTPSPGSPFACGENPNDIAIGDMNGDGNPDLIIANTQTPYITILLGDGKGGFSPAPHSPFATTSRPHVHGVAVGDFMGDGKLSVVTDSWGNDSIILLPGDGHGNLLTPGKSFDADIHSDQGVRAAAFNGDGKLDIVMTNQAKGAVGLMLGDGKGGFTRAPHSPFPAVQVAFAFTVGDVNGDGIPDVAVMPYDRDLTDPSQLGVVILLGDGKAGFTKMRGSPFSLEGCAGPDRVAIGDVTGDGVPDFVVSCAQNAQMMVFEGSRNGTFKRATIPVKTGWSGLAISDVRGDGKKEIVISNGELDEAPEGQPGTITIFSRK
jgi:hypothetical protein